MNAMASNLLAMAFTPVAMACNLLAMASNLLAMAFTLLAMASTLVAKISVVAPTSDGLQSYLGSGADSTHEAWSRLYMQTSAADRSRDA